jgi:hypothetical protein
MLYWCSLGVESPARADFLHGRSPTRRRGDVDNLGSALAFSTDRLAPTLVICIMHVVLAQENRRLRGIVEELQGERDQALEIPPGTVLPSFEATNWRGERVSVEYGSDPRPTLLFVFSPTCPACQENWPLWRELVELVKQRPPRLLVVDLSSQVGPEYLEGFGLPRESLIKGVNPSETLLYRFGVVPQTILIGGSGVVEGTRTGMLRRSDLQRFATALDKEVM